MLNGGGRRQCDDSGWRLRSRPISAVALGVVVVQLLVSRAAEAAEYKTEDRAGAINYDDDWRGNTERVPTKQPHRYACCHSVAAVEPTVVDARTRFSNKDILELNN